MPLAESAEGEEWPAQREVSTWMREQRSAEDGNGVECPPRRAAAPVDSSELVVLRIQDVTADVVI